MTGEIVVVITIFKFKILSQDFVHSLSYQNCNSFYVLPFYFACFLISLLLVISLQSEGSLLHTVRPLSGNAENAFFHISLPSLHDYDDVRVPNFTLLGGRDQRKKRTFFFLSSTSKRLISAPEKFAHISRIEGDEMKYARSSGANSLFKIRFCGGRRRRCLSSPF